MENKRPIQRRDFLKSATAASLLAGAAPLVVAEAAEPAKAADGTQNQAAASGSIVGQEAADCVANLLRGMDNVRSLSVFEAPLRTKPKQRAIENGSYYDCNSKRPLAASAEDEKIISKALKLRADSKMPFWDAVLLVCHENVPQATVAGRPAPCQRGPHFKGPDRHAPAGARRSAQAPVPEQGQVELGRYDFGSGPERWQRRAHSHALLPLPDFSGQSQSRRRGRQGNCSPAAASSSRPAWPIRRMANRPSRRRTCAWLGRALLFGNVVNHRYIAHQLIDGKCSVRISAGNSKNSLPGAWMLSEAAGAVALLASFDEHRKIDHEYVVRTC